MKERAVCALGRDRLRFLSDGCAPNYRGSYSSIRCQIHLEPRGTQTKVMVIWSSALTCTGIVEGAITHISVKDQDRHSNVVHNAA